jgi:hypothetical protein
MKEFDQEKPIGAAVKIMLTHIKKVNSDFSIAHVLKLKGMTYLSRCFYVELYLNATGEFVEE